MTTEYCQDYRQKNGSEDLKLRDGLVGLEIGGWFGGTGDGGMVWWDWRWRDGLVGLEMEGRFGGTAMPWRYRKLEIE